jgi:putative transposase
VTDLKGPVKGERYPLYVVLDLFSRYVVAWMLARRETAALAQRLLRTACIRQGIVAGQLTTHSDRGSIQVAKDLHDLYQDLGIFRSLSRPRISNDNAYSEAQFKTTKYAPTIRSASTASRMPRRGVTHSSGTTTTRIGTRGSRL